VKAREGKGERKKEYIVPKNLLAKCANFLSPSFNLIAANLHFDT